MAEYSDTEKIASLISASSDIMLVGHTNPDGDSVGSLIAMGCFLEDMGKKVLRVVPNELPRPLRNVKGKVKIYEFVSSEAYVRERARTCDLVVYGFQRHIFANRCLVGGGYGVRVSPCSHRSPSRAFARRFQCGHKRYFGLFHMLSGL